MRTSKLLLGLMLVALQSITQPSIAQHGSWKEMEAFHEVISKTFHPAEENNLKPLKENIAALTEKAMAWKKAKVPAGFNAALTATTLKKLATQVTDLQKAVKDNKEDAILKKKITDVHDTFHQVAEKCRDNKQTIH